MMYSIRQINHRNTKDTTLNTLNATFYDAELIVMLKIYLHLSKANLIFSSSICKHSFSCSSENKMASIEQERGTYVTDAFLSWLNE